MKGGIVVYLSNDKRYCGRFLGLIADDEFNALIENIPDVAKRIYTVPTKSAVDVMGNKHNLAGHRLVMALKERGGIVVHGKKLFVSPRLRTAVEVDYSKKTAKMKAEDGGEIRVVEDM
jgi:hypothetical protein